MSAARIHRAGESIEDFCRACKTDRTHTVIAVDGAGYPIRVTCDYCESQHNYRGGPRIEPFGQPAQAPSTSRTVTSAAANGRCAFVLSVEFAGSPST